MKPIFEFSLTLFFCALVIVACAHNPNTSETPGNREVVEFPYWYGGRFPDKTPETWNEHYNAGVWLFREGNFPEALDHFLAAVELATGEAQRTCLTAAAISALGAGDPRYKQLIDRLEVAGPENAFRETTIIDRVIPVLKGIKYPEGGGHDKNS